MRTIVIGDVHGCLQEFRDLLRLVSYEQGTDRLIQLGDLMDRGPDPVGCVRFAQEVGAIFVRGNHEDKHLRWRKHEAVRASTGKKNPMKPFPPERAEQNAQLSDGDIAWLERSPTMYDIADQFVAVHAGMEPAYSRAKQSAQVLRVRYVDDRGIMVGFTKNSLAQPTGTAFWSTRWHGPESVVYGHAVHSLVEPRVDAFPGGACYGIDTGCVYGGRLSALLYAGGAVSFAQVQARETYYHSEHGQQVVGRDAC